MKASQQNINWTLGEYTLAIAHPMKVYWPEAGYTKLDLLTYYRDMAPMMLPYFENRPVTVRFFPRGIADFSYYRRDFGGMATAGMHTTSYREISQDKTLDVLMITHQIGLLEMVSKGGIEFHLWSATMPDFSKPDLVIFDLDTHTVLDFEKVLFTALELRKVLETMGLRSYPKTSGGTGLHVYVPIKADCDFLTVRNWVISLAETLARQFPKIIATPDKGLKTHIKNKVTIDPMQNVISRNTVAPYSVRAFPGATVSTPLHWEEIEQANFLPADFNITNVVPRVLEKGDPFAEVLSRKQNLQA